MSYFDLIINIIEPFICTLFIYRLFKKNLLLYILVSTFYFFIITICNYVNIPEVILIVSSIIILYLYSNYLNKVNSLQNIFIALFYKNSYKYSQHHCHINYKFIKFISLLTGKLLFFAYSF